MVNTDDILFWVQQPILIATLVTAIPYFISIILLYRKYTYCMTPREKEIIWGGLASRSSSSSSSSYHYLLFRFWTATALLSAIAFLMSWITYLLAVLKEANSSSNNSSSNNSNNNSTNTDRGISDGVEEITFLNAIDQYVFSVIMLLQTAFNIILMIGDNTISKNSYNNIIETKLIVPKIVSIGIVLWGAAISYIWLWYIMCWDMRLISFLFLSPDNKNNDKDNNNLLVLGYGWLLHFLNACFVFHGVWWDAFFWWYTWSRELRKEYNSYQMLMKADDETRDIFEDSTLITILKANDHMNTETNHTTTTTTTTNGRCTILSGTNYTNNNYDTDRNSGAMIMISSLLFSLLTGEKNNCESIYVINPHDGDTTSTNSTTKHFDIDNFKVNYNYNYNSYNNNNNSTGLFESLNFYPYSPNIII